MRFVIFCLVGALATIAIADCAKASDDNPGFLDNPGCIALIESQLADNGQDPLDYDIKYVTSAQMPDGNGGTQTFSVVNKRTGAAMIVVIGAHWQIDTGRTTSL